MDLLNFTDNWPVALVALAIVSIWFMISVWLEKPQDRQ